MNLKQHLTCQVEAALGSENRWYCSEFYGREITDPDVLLEYFIKHGGAEHFGAPRAHAHEAHEAHGPPVDALSM
jgi:hypothetical protein